MKTIDIKCDQCSALPGKLCNEVNSIKPYVSAKFRQSRITKTVAISRSINRGYMTESDSDKKSFIDKMFDGADLIIGGLEKSKELSEPYPDDKIDKSEDKDIIDAEFVSHKSSNKPKLIWGFVKEYHLFEGFAQSSICGSFFEATDIKDRKTEMDGSRITCCGICLRILHSKYVNS